MQDPEEIHSKEIRLPDNGAIVQEQLDHPNDEATLKDKLMESQPISQSQSSSQGQSSLNEAPVKEKVMESETLGQSQSSTQGQSSLDEAIIKDRALKSEASCQCQSSIQCQSSLQDQVCELHKEIVQYYCETEMRPVCMKCQILNSCPPDHLRLSLKDAVVKQRQLLGKMMTRCQEQRTQFQEAVSIGDKAKVKLNGSVEKIRKDLSELHSQYVSQVDQVFHKQMKEIEEVRSNKVKHLEDNQKVVTGEICRMEEVIAEVSNLVSSKTDFVIMREYSNISNAFQELSAAKPVLDAPMGYLGFQKLPMSVPSPGHLMFHHEKWALKHHEKWKLKSKFSVKPLQKPQVLTINQDGDVAVTSFASGVKVFSKTGQMKRSFMEDCCRITGVAVSRGNKYIVASSGEHNETNTNSYFWGLFTTQHRDYRAVRFYTEDGEYLSEFFVKDVFDNVSFVNTIAVDNHDQIIAGVTSGLNSSTISIHNSNGSLKSRFFTQSIPFRLAATWDGKIVCCCRYEEEIKTYKRIGSERHLKVTKTVKLMDYTGQNVRDVAPPPEVTSWNPGCVCCGGGDIFVVNKGVPTGIFQYISNGDYLGCVTMEVSNNPGGIALSPDGMELFVVEIDTCVVKVFNRK